MDAIADQSRDTSVSPAAADAEGVFGSVTAVEVVEASL